jgi:D-sedoheptulose 7-phosphate isomerase
MEGEMSTTVAQALRGTARMLEAMADDPAIGAAVEAVAKACVASLKAGGKVLLAGEFVSRFAFDRPGLPAIALTTDTSVLTAIGNDYGYERVFERQVQALGVAGDVFFGITTSGRSPNVLRALEQARARGLVTVGMTGNRGGPIHALCDHVLAVPSPDTPRIQEGHIVLAHTVCLIVERRMFGG